VSLGPSTAIVDRLVEAIAVSGGRRAGDPETRVHLDHLMPSPSGPAIAGPARWRLSTSQARFYPAPVRREALRAWHAADAPKGRRLLATDVANDHQIAAMLSWHFEPGGRGRRPHLITAAAIWHGAAAAELSEDYLLALWLLCCATVAIDRLTSRRKHVGLVLDSAIELDRDQLRLLGFRPGSRRGGYEGDYFVFDARRAK
jgi:hypothetical protein